MNLPIRLAVVGASRGRNFIDMARQCADVVKLTSVCDPANGHGGGDFFVLREFTAAIIEGRPPLIDVYDAVTWSSLAPLSRDSITRGNMPVTIPDYARQAAAP